MRQTYPTPSQTHYLTTTNSPQPTRLPTSAHTNEKKKKKGRKETEFTHPTLHYSKMYSPMDFIKKEKKTNKFEAPRSRENNQMGLIFVDL